MKTLPPNIGYSAMHILVCGWLLPLFLLVSSIAQGQQIPEFRFPKKASDWIDFARQDASMRLVDVDLYKRHSTDPASTRPKAKEFLTLSAWWEAGLPHKCPTPFRFRRLRELATELDELGCEDPLVQRTMARVLYNYLPAETVRSKASRAMKSFIASEYHPGQAIWYRILIAEADHDTHRRRGKRKRTLAVYNAIADYLVWASAQEDWQRPTFLHVNRILDRIERLETEDDAAFASAVDEYRKNESADKWFVAMLDGMVDRMVAWNARGKDYINTVSKKNLEIFQRNLEKASVHFRNAWELAPDRPEAAHGMLRIALADGSKEDLWKWFHRSNEAQVDYSPSWGTVWSALEPKWGGSLEARKEFLDQMYAAGRFHTRLPKLFCDGAYRDDRRKVFSADEVTLGQCTESYRGMLKSPAWQQPDGMSIYEVRFLAEMFTNACFGTKHLEVIELGEKLKDEFQSEEVAKVFKHWDIRPSYELSRAYAYRDFEAELFELRPASGRRREGVKFSRELNKGYQEILKTSGEDAEHYLKTWETLTALELEYDKGDWVQLTFDPDLSLWVRRGNWTFENQSVVLDNTIGSPDVFLLHKSFFPSPIELEVEFESAGLEVGGLHAGIIRVAEGKDKNDWPLLGGKIGGNSTVQSKVKKARLWPTAPIKKMEVMCWGLEGIELHVNGLQIPESQIKDTKDKQVGVGLASLFWRTDRGQVRVKSFRVRKVPFGPPPKGREGIVDWYTQALKRYPHRIGYFKHRGIALFGQKKFKQAIADLEKVAGKLDKPRNMWVGYALGSAQMQNGQRDAGIKTLFDVYEMTPTKKPHPSEEYFGFAAAIELIRLATFASDPTSEELQRLEPLASELVQRSGKADSYIALAMVQLAKGEQSEARQSLATAQQQKPDSWGLEMIAKMGDRLDDH